MGGARLLRIQAQYVPSRLSHDPNHSILKPSSQARAAHTPYFYSEFSRVGPEYARPGVRSRDSSHGEDYIPSDVCEDVIKLWLNMKLHHVGVSMVNGGQDYYLILIMFDSSSLHGVLKPCGGQDVSGPPSMFHSISHLIPLFRPDYAAYIYDSS